MTSEHSAEKPSKALSRREKDVLEQLARGGTNQQIAEALGIAERTVGHHLEKIYRKLGVTTRTEASVLALSQGIIGPVRR